MNISVIIIDADSIWWPRVPGHAEATPPHLQPDLGILRGQILTASSVLVSKCVVQITNTGVEL